MHREATYNFSIYTYDFNLTFYINAQKIIALCD